MNFKKLGLSLALASAAVLGTGAAHALCITEGTSFQIATDGGTTYIWVRPTNVTSFFYFFTTTNPQFANTMNNSLHGHVQLIGSASSCPTSGISRYGGVMSLIYAN